MTTPIAYAIVTADATGATSRTFSKDEPSITKLAAAGWEWVEDRDGSRYYENDTHRMAVHPLFYELLDVAERDEP